MSVAILGGGISGLLAAYALRDKQPFIVEASNGLGGTFTAGGLKYVRQTPAFEALLGDLQIPFSVYQPRGAMLQSPVPAKPVPAVLQVVEHPAWMLRQPPDRKYLWQSMHWQKTRGSMDGFKPTCMNDPSGEGSAPALAFDHHLFMNRLESRLRGLGIRFAFGAKVVGVERDHFRVQRDGQPVEVIDGYKLLLTTLPLPLMGKLAPWTGLPTEAKTATLTVAFLKALPRWFIDCGGEGFDYMYTPLMADIHRISRFRDRNGKQGWQAEASGKVEPEAFARDLGFPGYVEPFIEAIARMPGHLLPLGRVPAWPDFLRPIGRYAEWNPRSTSETVLDLALSLRDRC